MFDSFTVIQTLFFVGMISLFLCWYDISYFDLNMSIIVYLVENQTKNL